MNIQKPSLQFRNSLSVRKSTRCIVLHHADAEKFSVYQCHACHLNNGGGPVSDTIITLQRMVRSGKAGRITLSAHMRPAGMRIL